MVSEQKNSIVDFKRTFKTIIREILIKKFEIYGVKGKELQWLQSYLTNRGEQTKTNGEYSSTKSNDLDIPQESVLAALLFFI
jgi:hypothetical protein